MAAAVLALMLLGGTACGHARYLSAPPLQPFEQRLLPESSASRHVVLISIDGLRPDAIGFFATPTLERLMREGSYTLTASTIMPSKTLPSHTSMLSGEPPERHGVLWNDWRGGRGTIEAPTIFSVARSAGYTTAAFFSKSKFQHLQRPGTLDYSQAPGGWFGRWSNERTARDVETHLTGAKPNVLFVHLSDPDRTGHRSGWMGEPYGRAVTAADAAVARVLAAADRAYGSGNYSVIVTADHGGHDRDHGSDDPRDVTIPWIAWGRGVAPGALVGAHVRTIDTAPTVLWLLGVPEPPGWAGIPVVEAFGKAQVPVPMPQGAQTGHVSEQVPGL